MAIYKKDADPVALPSAAERITAHARECDAACGEAARAMGALRGSWGGGDLDTLMTRWAPVDAQLGPFGTDLGALAETLRRNAGQQDATSGPGGGAPGVPPIPPANLICGGVAAAMGVGQLIYDNNEAFQDFVDGGVDVDGDAAGAMADTAGDVLDAVTPDVDWPW